MPVSETVAITQVRRFQQYPNFPDAGGQIVLKRAFREACEDDEHAKKVGDYLIRTVHFAPVAADIYEAVNAVRLSDEGRIPEWTGGEYRCTACQDTGWQVTERGAKRCIECSRAKLKELPKVQKAGQ